jgi:hypothetical protein
MFTGCNSGGSGVSENNIRFDSLLVEKTYHLLEVETNPKCSLQIKFVFPTDYANREVLGLVQQQFVAGFFGDEYVSLPPKEAAEKYAADYINAYKAEETNFKLERENHDFEPLESWYSYNETSNNQIVYNQKDLLSCVVFMEYFKGGAHNAHQYTNRTIDLRTGQRITENEIFIDDYQVDLAKIIVDEIALVNSVEAAELENIGFFNVAEIYPNKNFYVDATGITYTFNEYEIAAYVVGPVTVTIPYEKIAYLLRRESPISHIVFK